MKAYLNWLGCAAVGVVLTTAACGGGSTTSDVAASGGASASGGRASSSGGSAAVGDSVPLDQYIIAFARASCEVLTRCYEAPSTVQECVDYNEPSLSANFQPTHAAVVEGRVSYDARAAAELIRAMATVACEEVGTLDESLPKFAVFSGTRAAGATCSVNEECQGSAACIGEGTCPGRCAARAKQGEACADSAQCAPGLTCRRNVCVTRKRPGETCTSADACQSFLSCQDDGTGVTTCQSLYGGATRKKGESCNGDEGSCAALLACQAKPASTGAARWPGVCVERVAAGGSCQDASPSMCPNGQYCAVPEGSSDGTCTAKPLAGSACGKELGLTYVCASGLTCVEGTCLAPKPNAAVCTSEAECASDNCVEGQCAAVLDCALKVEE